MQFPLTPDEEAFRLRIREFCRECLPRDLAARVVAGVDLTRDDYVGWQKILSEAGLLCGAWPREHGGQGWSPLQSYLFDEECALAGAPWLLPFGVNYVGARHPHPRHGGAEAAIPAGDRQRRHVLVPGLFGAGCRIRSCRAPHARGARRGFLRRHRAQDLDDDGALGRPHVLSGAHQHRRQAAGRHLLPARST